MNEGPGNRQLRTPWPDTSPYGLKHHPVEFLQSNVARLKGRHSEDDMVRYG